MMVPVVKCDHCQSDIPPETRSAIVDLALPQQRPTRYSGENCADCEDKFAHALTELLGEYLNLERKPQLGRPPKVKPADDHRPGPAKGSSRKPRQTSDGEEYDAEGWAAVDRTCKICGRLSPTRSACGQHLAAKHQTTFRKLGMLETHEERLERFARLGK